MFEGTGVGWAGVRGAQLQALKEPGGRGRLSTGLADVANRAVKSCGRGRAMSRKGQPGEDCLSLRRQCLVLLIASLGLVIYPVLPSRPLWVSGSSSVFKGSFFYLHRAPWPIGDPRSGRAHAPGPHTLSRPAQNGAGHDRKEGPFVTGKLFVAPASSSLNPFLPPAKGELPSINVLETKPEKSKSQSVAQ